MQMCRMCEKGTQHSSQEHVGRVGVVGVCAPTPVLARSLACHHPPLHTHRAYAQHTLGPVLTHCQCVRVCAANEVRTHTASVLCEMLP